MREKEFVKAIVETNSVTYLTRKTHSKIFRYCKQLFEITLSFYVKLVKLKDKIATTQSTYLNLKKCYYKYLFANGKGCKRLFFINLFLMSLYLDQHG